MRKYNCRSWINRWYKDLLPCSVLTTDFALFCFSCRIQQSVLGGDSVQQLPQQHGHIKQHLCQSPFYALHIFVLYSAAKRPQHGYNSAQCDIIFLSLPAGRPVTAKCVSDRLGHLAVSSEISLRMHLSQMSFRSLCLGPNKVEHACYVGVSSLLSIDNKLTESISSPIYTD